MQTKVSSTHLPLNRIVTLIAVTGIMLLATACGGTPTPTTMPAPATTEPAVVPNLDICSLATTEEVTAVLGQAPLNATPGSDPDNSTGTTINFCTYLGGNGLAVVISSVDTGTVEAGQAMIATQLSLAPDMVVTEESGIGDKAYWSVGAKAVSYTVLKDTHVFSVALGGAIGDPASHKDALLALAQAVAANQ
jgi:hypothetical protein